MRIAFNDRHKNRASSAIAVVGNVGREFWRTLEYSGALGGGMGTRFRPLQLNCLRPGDQPVSWPVAMIEERNRLAREIRETLVRDFAGTQLRLFT